MLYRIAEAVDNRLLPRALPSKPFFREGPETRDRKGGGYSPSRSDYLRPSLASMHSVAWGTFIRRSLGMSLPVVLQMP